MTFTNVVEATRNDTVTVGASSVIISDARPSINRRKVILVRNNSTDLTAVVTVNQGYNAAVNGQGVVLKAGESYTDVDDVNSPAYQGGITAICSNANGVLAIFER